MVATNRKLNTFAKGEYEAYQDWIVAWVDGTWRKCHIATGFCTIAPWDKPNHHIGIFKEEAINDAFKRTLAGHTVSRIMGHELEGSPFILVGPTINDKDILKRLAYVRFGCTHATGARMTDSSYLVDLLIGHGLSYKLGDKLPHELPDINQPEPSDTWRRTIRSTIFS